MQISFALPLKPAESFLVFTGAQMYIMRIMLLKKVITLGLFNYIVGSP